MYGRDVKGFKYEFGVFFSIVDGVERGVGE